MAKANLQDALEIAKFTLQQTTDKTATICTSQCNILIAGITHVEDFLNQICKSGHNSEKAHVWGEVISAMQKGLQLLKRCWDEDWIITTLLCEESSESFQGVYTELYDCVELVSVYLFALSSSDMQKSTVAKAYNSCLMRKRSHSMLVESARNDREQLVQLALMSKEKNSGSLMQMLCKLWEKEPRITIAHDQLTMKKHIGHGSFGAVYEAVWLGRTFAVKVYSEGDTSFTKEIKALAFLKHPNILSIIGHSYDPEKREFSLVMEKMDLDLAEFIKKRGVLPDLDVISILLQVATAMEYLHLNNTIHRDLKPQNVLVMEKQLSVKISDFGLARTDFITSIANGTLKQGTRNFMAPEVWNSQRYSRKADVYSYAMLAYQVVSGGSVPFKNEAHKLDFMDKVCEGFRPTLPKNCLSDIGDLIKRCWSQDPDARPSFNEIHNMLKIIKATHVTKTSFNDERTKLVSFSVVPDADTQDPNHSKVETVDFHPLFKTSSNKGQSSKSNEQKEPRNPLYYTSQPQPQQQSYRTQPQPQYTEAPPRRYELDNTVSHRQTALPDVQKHLFQLLKKGETREAFQKALSLEDPANVWWLCTQVLSILEMINHNFDKDTAERLVWIDKALPLITSDNTSMYKNVSRLKNFFEKLSQNLYGQLAVTPKHSELAESLNNMLHTSIYYLQMARTWTDMQSTYPFLRMM